MSAMPRTRPKRKTRRLVRRGISYHEIRAITYLSTLLFAAFLAEKGVDTATIYGFLGMAIGAIFGKYFQARGN